MLRPGNKRIPAEGKSKRPEEPLRPLFAILVRNREKGGLAVCNRYWLIGVCALCLGLGIFICAIFPTGLLLFLVASVLIGCGWACIRRR